MNMTVVQSKSAISNVLPIISDFGRFPKLSSFRKLDSAFVFDFRIAKSAAARILRKAYNDACSFELDGDFRVYCEVDEITGKHRWCYYSTKGTGADVGNLMDVTVRNGKVVSATWDFGYFVEVRSDGKVRYTIDPEATDFDA
jgi:hypothetical protein